MLIFFFILTTLYGSYDTAYILSHGMHINSPLKSTENQPEEQKNIVAEKSTSTVSSDLANNTKNKEYIESDFILQTVPFTSQAPLAEWDDPRQQDACEEASVYMAMLWVNKGVTPTHKIAKEQILAMVEYQINTYGSAVDTSATDTLERLIFGYYGYEKAMLKQINDSSDLKKELYADSVVIVPTDGTVLGNPNFTAPGPDRHMLVIIGYDAETNEFITNDPGTRNGKSYRYDADILFTAIGDYPSGDHVPITNREKNILVIWR